MHVVGTKCTRISKRSITDDGYSSVVTTLSPTSLVITYAFAPHPYGLVVYQAVTSGS